MSEVDESKTKKRRRQQKSGKFRSKKRPIDPKRPWLDSDGEADDCAFLLEDDSDDDAFIQRLQEEKEREEAEERRKKAEVCFSLIQYMVKMKRQRQLQREERRARATGKVGRPKAQLPFSHIYANSTDDPQVKKLPLGLPSPLP